MAALIDDALATLPAGEDPYAPARSAVDTLMMARPGPWPLELLWSFWLDAMRLDDALAVARGLPGLPAGSTVARLLSGLASDPARVDAGARAEAYRHAYGLRLDPVTPPTLLRQARVPAALATLPRRAARLLRDDDDTTVNPDGLPLLHALADLQNLLNEAVHPALEDMTRAVRRDMLLALYALGRPELRPLLPIRRHVVLPEPWMPAVDALATLEHRPQVSAGVYGVLAEAGERLLLSVRFGGWAVAADGELALGWARFWRAEIHNYTLSRAIVAATSRGDAARDTASA